jgi:hypothetical protein
MLRPTSMRRPAPALLLAANEFSTCIAYQLTF